MLHRDCLKIAASVGAALLFACGAPQTPEPTPVSGGEPADAVPRSEVLDRCIELSRLLPYAAATREPDTMLTAWYSIDAALPACRAEARSNASGGMDTRIALAVLDLIGLQAAHVASDAYFLEDGVGPPCDLAIEKNVEASDLLDRVEQIGEEVEGTSAAATVDDLRSAIEREARFFALAAGYLCVRNEAR